MDTKKKLQVFVSSTYQDLREQRQAAVEAILGAGHIPAGMELFAAGDESQMAVIRRWIDESDVFLLILGGRYGSIEASSGKSYVHIEYEYALERGKPVFAVVIDEEHRKQRVRDFGEDVIETENLIKLKEFRELVLSRIVKFWKNPQDIRLAIFETLADFSRRPELVGWVRGDQKLDTAAVAEELARLGRENAQLRAAAAPQLYNGLPFEQLVKLVSAESVEMKVSEFAGNGFLLRRVQRITAEDSVKLPLLDWLWLLREPLASGAELPMKSVATRAALERLKYYLIVGAQEDRFRDLLTHLVYRLTPDGHRFLLRVATERVSYSLFSWDLSDTEAE